MNAMEAVALGWLVVVTFIVVRPTPRHPKRLALTVAVVAVVVLLYVPYAQYFEHQRALCAGAYESECWP